MAEKIAVVCAREGVDTQEATNFMIALHLAHPDNVVISGGADPESWVAEDFWLANGGRVISWRTRKVKDEHYVVVRWEGWDGSFQKVWVPHQEPSFADQKSAYHYRDILIAEECDRLVAFYGERRSRGAGFTAAMAGNYGKDVYEYTNDA